MRNNIRVLGVSAVILIFAASMLFAAERERGGFERMVAYLGLNPAQIASINQEVWNFERAEQPAMEKMRQAEAQMDRAIGTKDTATVGRLTLERIELNRQFNEERKAVQNRVRSILTPEQAETLDRAIEVLHVVGVNASLLGPLSLGAEDHEVLLKRIDESTMGRGTPERRMKISAGGVPGGGPVKEIKP